MPICPEVSWVNQAEEHKWKYTIKKRPLSICKKPFKAKNRIE